MCFRYYVEQIPEPVKGELYYKINKMSFNFDEIKPDTYFTVSYPEKTGIVNDGDDSEIINQLEKAFHEKIDELGFTWEEFDNFMLWYAYVESIDFKGT